MIVCEKEKGNGGEFREGGKRGRRGIERKLRDAGRAAWRAAWRVGEAGDGSNDSRKLFSFL